MEYTYTSQNHLRYNNAFKFGILSYEILKHEQNKCRALNDAPILFQS